MNVEENMLILGKLSRADRRLTELQVILKDGPRELRDHRRSRDEAVKTVENARADRQRAEAARHDAERELDLTERRLLQSHENAKRIATEVQMEASNIELGALQKRRDGWEEEVLAEMAQAEKIDGLIPGLQQDLEAVEAALAKVERSVPEMIKEAKREAVALLRVRDGLLKELDAVVRRLYDTAATRGGNPMTTVLDKVCQVCHTTVPPQYLVETQQEKAIHVCTGCKRIIGKVLHSEEA